MKTFIICGGRTFGTPRTKKPADEQQARYEITAFWLKMNQVHAKYGEFRIIHGGAKGADSMSGKWGNDMGFDVHIFPANWDKYGKSAGFKRNQQMLDTKPDGVIAFPGGKGTAHTVREAKRMGITVWLPLGE